MADLAKLVVKLEAQTAQYQKKLKQADAKTKRFAKNTKKSLAGISKSFKALAAGAAIGLFVRKIVTATKKQEQAVKQLEQGLASTGGVVGQSLDELTKKAAELQKVTTFGDEEIIDAQAKLVTFTGIVEDQFDRTIEAALDLSERMGQELTSSVVQLGKAINDPIKNLSALTRVGIQFTDSQTDMIKALVNSNRLMEAQDIILGELERQFGGSAKAARDTFSDALDSLGNAFDDLFESSSQMKEATAQVEELIALLRDPSTVENINKLTAATLRSIGAIAKFVTTTTGLFGFMGDEIAALANGAAIGDLVRLEEQLARLNKQLEINLASAGRAGRSTTDPTKSVIPGLREEIRLTEEKIKVTNAAMQAQVNAEIAAKSFEGGPAIAKKSSPVIDLVAIEAAKDAVSLQESQLKSFLSTLESLRTPMQVFNDQQAIAKSLLEAGKISLEDYNNSQTHYAQTLNETTVEHQQWIKDLADSASMAEALKTEVELLDEELARARDLWAKGLLSDEALKRTAVNVAKQKDEIANATDEMSQFGIEAARNIQDAFADFLFDPFAEGMDGMLEGFAKTIQRMIAEAASAQLMEAFGFENFLSGGSSGEAGWLQQGASFLGGFFADGGRPPPGKVSVVGEQGPELFIPDGVSGSIIPNGAMGGNTVQISSMVFPGVRTEKEAKIAAGAAARQLSSLVSGGGRYS